MDLSVKQLEEAVAVRRQIDQLQSRLSSLLGSGSRGSSGGSSSNSGSSSSAETGGSGGSSSSQTTVKRRSGISAAGRARIAAAARARWARAKAGSGGGSDSGDSSRSAKKTGMASKQSGKGNGISAAGRKKLSQMMKARWAARRKAQGK